MNDYLLNVKENDTMFAVEKPDIRQLCDACGFVVLVILELL